MDLVMTRAPEAAPPRADGAIRFAVGACSLGFVLVARSDAGICAILLGDDPQALADDLRRRFPATAVTGDAAGLHDTLAAVIGGVEAPGSGPDLPLDLRGTAFQRRVWQALRAIPPGRTASYAEIARRIGEPGSARAVAQACGANPVAVVVPCHRVVAAGGALSGYRWGTDRKRALLHREARA